jgi:imidazolonepropionase
VKSVVVDRIGELVTCDPSLGAGPLGILRDASVVFEGERIISVGPAGQSADECIDADGASVIPGFVDSHTHLVFAGDRSAEWAARMAGLPYAAGGIRTTVEATAAVSDDELRRIVARRRAEAFAAGITTVEVKSGYALSVDGERRLIDIASQFTPHTTFLGAHVVPAEYVDRSDEYVSLVCGDMLRASAPASRFCDVFCEVGAFDVDQSREVLRSGVSAGLIPKIHANQLGHGPGVQLAVEMSCASADHCTYLSDADVDALAGSATLATLLPAADFSTRQPYADGRRLLDAGCTVALATNCNPGSSATTSMSFCLAIAVREMHMTPEEALLAATVGGAAALRVDDVGVIRPGARADLCVLRAPSFVHLMYRPGVPLIAQVICGGQDPLRSAR